MEKSHVSDSNIPGTPDEPTGPTLQGALEQQLGLRLEAAKNETDILVIDNLKKTATEN
jgi:uncharacterized protein (TIGR03435 family)